MYMRHIAMTAIGTTMLATAAMAQTAAPTAPAAPQPAAPAVTAPTGAAAGAENNLTGQGKWRASKLIGVDIYGPDQKKVGDVTEIVLDKTGKIEMVTVGVGGFLGIGAKDVAIPFDQVQWSDMPMQPAATPAGGSGTAPAPAMPSTTAKTDNMYPDHGKITMTKEQLTDAPPVSYTAR